MTLTKDLTTLRVEGEKAFPLGQLGGSKGRVIAHNEQAIVVKWPSGSDWVSNGQ